MSYWWPASVPHSTLPVELCEMHVDNVVRTPPTQCNESDLPFSVSGLYDAFRELTVRIELGDTLKCLLACSARPSQPCEDQTKVHRKC